MDLKVNVSGRIAKPVEVVFEAVVNPEHLSHFFTTGGAQGRLESGKTVMWDFADFPGAFPVRVETVVPNEKIVLYWGAQDDAPPTPRGTGAQASSPCSIAPDHVHTLCT